VNYLNYWSWTCSGSGAPVNCSASYPPPCPPTININWDGKGATPLLAGYPVLPDPNPTPLPNGDLWCYYEKTDGDTYCSSWNRNKQFKMAEGKYCGHMDFQKALYGGQSPGNDGGCLTGYGGGPPMCKAGIAPTNIQTMSSGSTYISSVNGDGSYNFATCPGGGLSISATFDCNYPSNGTASCNTTYCGPGLCAPLNPTYNMSMPNPYYPFLSSDPNITYWVAPYVPVVGSTDPIFCNSGTISNVTMPTPSFSGRICPSGNPAMSLNWSCSNGVNSIYCMMGFNAEVCQ
jgi:hypothetical protein